MTSSMHLHSVETLLKDYSVYKQNKQISYVTMYLVSYNESVGPHGKKYGKQAQENTQILDHGTFVKDST